MNDKIIIREEDMNNEKFIINEDGLFYSNFDRLALPLYLIEGSESYSENLVKLRDIYGIKIGEQQPTNGEMIDGLIGVYIVNYQKYLSDLREKQKADSNKASSNDQKIQEILDTIDQRIEGLGQEDGPKLK